MSEPAKGDAYQTMCVIKDKNGVEVGRILATAPGAPEYVDRLARQHGAVSVEYTHDENAGLIGGLLGRMN